MQKEQIKKQLVAAPKRITTVFPRFCCYCLLTVIAFEFVFPYLYMFVTSLKGYDDLQNLAVYWIPTKLHFENFSIAANALNIRYGMVNSILVSVLATVGHVLSCSMIGYGFARYEFPFKNILFVGVLLSTIIPVQATLISQYMVYSKLKILETLLPLILPCFFGFGLRGGVYIFLFRQFFLRFPASLEEAALLDGCGRQKTFWTIAFPSAKSPMLVAIVMSIVWHWNDYYEPKTYLTGGPKTQLLTQSLPDLYALLNESQLTESTLSLVEIYHEGVIMAATAIAFVPILIMFAFLQKQFMEGVERSGLVE